MSNRRNALYPIISVLLLAATFTGRTVFLHLAYVLVLLFIGALVWSWLAVRWVSIGRQTPAERAQVGRPFEERFVVKNTGFIPKLWLEVRDQSSLPDHRASHVVPTMLPRRQYRWTVNTICRQRGQFTLGPLTINSGDPFGLFQFPRYIRSTRQIIVYPATVPVYDFASPIGRLSGGQAVQRRTYEVTTNAAGIREYAPGDSLNRIHWKTTARRGKLYVKEFELDPLSDVWIFVDFDRNTAYKNPAAANSVQGDGSWQLLPTTEEYSVTCAASIAEYYLDKDRALGMVAYTPFREIIQPDRGNRQLSRVLEMLALARSETDVSLTQMLAIDADLVARGNTLVIITASMDTAWIREAELLRRRGLHVVAVVIDPTSFGYSHTNFKDLHAQAEDAGIRVYPVRQGENLTQSLSYDPIRRTG